MSPLWDGQGKTHVFVLDKYTPDDYNGLLLKHQQYEDNNANSAWVESV